MSSKLEQLVQQQVAEISREKSKAEQAAFERYQRDYGFLLTDAGASFTYNGVPRLTFQVGNREYVISDITHDPNARQWLRAYRYPSPRDLMWELAVANTNEVIRALALKAEVKS
jgi:hypothetical protein